jgi:hypothetical protein
VFSSGTKLIHVYSMECVFCLKNLNTALSIFRPKQSRARVMESAASADSHDKLLCEVSKDSKAI